MNHMVEWYLMTTKERAAVARHHILELGWSYTELAAHLGVTRNVIAGICSRSGIKTGTSTNAAARKALAAQKRPTAEIVQFKAKSQIDREEAVADMVKKVKAKRTNGAQASAIQRIGGREIDMSSLIARDPRPLRNEYWQPLPGSAPIRLEFTESHHCRWPISEDNHTCCGAQAKEGKPYCATHCEIAYRPATPISFKKRKTRSAA